MIPSYPDLQAWFDALLAVPSVNPPGREPLMAEFLSPVLAGLGAVVTLQPVKEERGNLIAVWDWGPGPALLFNTHLDVNNPAGQAWSSDPFVPVRRDGRIYARGAADAKGSLAAMTWAAAGSAAHPEGLRGRLILTLVMGEESGGEGTLALMEGKTVEADGAVVGEPTDLRILAGNKGTFIRRLVFRGLAAHSGQSHLGRNAITAAARFVMAAAALDRRLKERPHPLIGDPSFTVTLIQGGTLQNTVPDQCAVTVDRRLVPGETHAQARQELADLLEREGLTGDVEAIEEIVASFPCVSPLETRIVEVASASIRAILGPDAPQAVTGGFPGGCDMSKLVLLGGIPSVIIGPGSLAQAHAADEWVEEEQVERAALIYGEIIRRFLKAM